MNNTSTYSYRYTSMILEELYRLYPHATAQLDFSNPFETLIATMLSAQCTDKRVNLVTKGLFAQIHTPKEMLCLTQEELEGIIHSCGVYRNKAKNILASCRILEEQYQGQVPGTIQELVSLPGVGPKTANVVFANAFGGDAIAVDTHVFRVSNRTGLAKAKNVELTEQQLRKVISQDQWSKAHHWLIWHGRQVCSARKPKCEVCTLSKWCRYAQQQENNGQVSL